jgi:holo-[acyl-carrier protein] synthase
MILGIGTDLVDIRRIEALMARYASRFITRVFTPEEIEYSTKRQDAASCFAGRFAAKEAAFKALSAERSSGIGFKEMQVRVSQNIPRLELTGKAQERARDLGVTRIHLSISHDKGCAVAIVVMEGAG